ncbi:hypothetical protein AB0A76_32780 [Streptomyces exfoliatus]|uniref:Tachylectin 2 domain-containing protein n=1 Tax=Streptomyces exfoliatus TaxID=1905 RepID=A0ABV3D7Q9_STREX
MAHVRAALAIATVLAVGVTPAVLGGTATAAVPLAAGAVSASGTVVQEGGTLVVPSGEEGPATTRIKASQYRTTTGLLKARLLLPTMEWDAGDESQSFGLTTTCAVNGGAFQSCSWDDTERGGVVPLPTAPASTSLTYDIRVDAGSSAPLRLGGLTATLEVFTEDGDVVARGPLSFTFVPGTPEAYLRTTVLARDKAGVLWQYESTGHADKPLKARKRIGGGWNVYTSLTSLTSRTAGGQGDLVARDRDGVLWYYEGSNNADQPFKPRVRIGGGWNQYTAIIGRGMGLVARDKSGVLWRYSRNGSDNPALMLDARRQVHTGFNIYTVLTGQANGYDALARDRDGVLWAYPSGWPGYDPRVRVGGGWNTYDTFTYTSDLDGVRYDDVIARDKEGRVWMYGCVYRNGTLVPTSTRKQIGWGWGIYDAIL